MQRIWAGLSGGRSGFMVRARSYLRPQRSAPFVELGDGSPHVGVAHRPEQLQLLLDDRRVGGDVQPESPDRLEAILPGAVRVTRLLVDPCTTRQEVGPRRLVLEHDR